MEFHGTQAEIIKQDKSNILVSAAAGSGKTTVLVERIIQKIIAGELSIDSVLVVTFTNDAAAHMADKIEAALNAKIEEVSESDPALAARLKDETDKLPNAYIQTFDSFCVRVISEKGYVVAGEEEDVFEPGNIVLGENEQNLILNAAISNVISQAYADCDSEEDPFIKFTYRFGDGRSDNSLISVLTDIYGKLRSIAGYNDRIAELAEMRREQDLTGEVKGLREFIADIHSRYEEILEALTAPGGLVNYIVSNHAGFMSGNGYSGKNEEKKRAAEDENYDRTYAFVQALVEYVKQVVDCDVNDLDAVIEKICETSVFESMSLSPINSIKNKAGKRGWDDPEDCIKPLTALCKFTRKIVGVKVKKYRMWSGAGTTIGKYDFPESYSRLICVARVGSAELLRVQKENTEMAAVAAKLLTAVDGEYTTLKKNLHGMDFPDQEHAAYRILNNSEAAEFYRERFEEIYIDEYQDNTNLQDEIIKLFSRDEMNVFRVGDVKQSIYRFRNSDPSIFMRLLNGLESGDVPGVGFALNTNYRSTPQVLEFVNFIFEQLMTDESSGITYDENQRLNPYEKAKTGDIPDVLLVDVSAGEDEPEQKEKESESEGDEAKSEEEALDPVEKDALLAGVLYKVEEYMKRPYAEYSDICVLTSKKTMAAACASFLNDCGYPASSMNFTQIFADNDIHRIVALIICLGNSHRDEYLAGVMLANFAFSNFTVSELAAIRQKVSYGGMSLIDRLRLYPEDAGDGIYLRIQKFLDVFDDLRMKACVSDIDEILGLIFKKTGIRQSVKDTNKFDIFKDWMSGQYKRYGCDISGIADALEGIKIKIDANGDIETRDTDKNKITVMNFHKSKGLEFKYVIIVLGNDRGRSDSTGGLGFDDKTGFVFDNYNEEKVFRTDSFESLMFADRMRVEDMAEKLRLLYVALTRAEEKLTVISTYKSSLKEKGKQPSVICDAFEKIKSEKRQISAKPFLEGGRSVTYLFFLGIVRATCAAAIRELQGLPAGNDEIDFIPCDSFTVEFMPQAKLPKVSANEIVPEEASDIATVEFDGEGNVKVPYLYSSETEIPFKVSVTGISEEGIKESTHVDLQIKSSEDYGVSSDLKISASVKGTVLHTIMRFADLENVESEFAGEIKALIDGAFFSGYSPELVMSVAKEFKSGICDFAASDIGRALIESDKKYMAEYEKPIVFAIPTSGFGNCFDNALVQGIIDLVFKTDDGYVLVDYKTDNLKNYSESEYDSVARERHSLQINCYAAALEKAGHRVCGKWIYLVRYSRFVSI